MALQAINLAGSIGRVTLAQMASITAGDGDIVYNSTYKQHFRYSNDRWWPLGVPDPRYGFLLADEFSSASSSSQLNWNANGAGALGNTGTYQGVFYVEQATALARSTLSTYTAGTAFGLGDYYIEAMVQIPTLATAGEDFCASFGFGDNLAYDANGACTDGAYITLNRAVNGAKWITNTTSNGTNTPTNTTAGNVIAGTWYRLGVLVSASNSNVVFTQNGVAMATHTTNIPSGAARSTGVIFKVDKTAGTAASDLYVDYFGAYGFFNSQRVS